MNPFFITTERLGLRKFTPSDLEPFAALNADPRVMERIGMKHTGEFDHPKVPAGHELERHVWYRVKK